MLNMDEFWLIIGQLEGRQLKTLERGRLFEVLSVEQGRVVLSPAVSGKPRTIRRDTLERAFLALRQRRELTSVEIMEGFSAFNAVYVASLLAALPGVAVCHHPVKLIWVGQQLFYL